MLSDIVLPENVPGMIELRDKLRTEDGRAFVTERLRDEAATIRGGFPTRRNQIAGGFLATVAGISDGIVAGDTVTGVRSPPPPTTGASVPFGTLGGNCAAPAARPARAWSLHRRTRSRVSSSPPSTTCSPSPRSARPTS